MYHFTHFKVNLSVTFTIFTVVCNQHLYLVPKHVCHLKRIPHTHHQSPHSFLWPLETTHLCSVPTYLPLLDVSHQWNPQDLFGFQ